MKTISKIGLGAAILAGFALAPVAAVLAADDQSRAHVDRPLDHPHGPPSGYHGRMPERAFRGVPPGFHGAARPQGSVRSEGGARMQGGAGMPSAQHQGSFHGHAFTEFTPQERESWTRGSWRHTSHNGHLGWWWYTGGFWFFYPEPIYPYPTYIGSEDYYEESEDYYWYWCDDPEGYYPYVQECNDEWEPVAPQPY